MVLPPDILYKLEQVLDGALPSYSVQYAALFPRPRRPPSSDQVSSHSGLLHKAPATPSFEPPGWKFTWHFNRDCRLNRRHALVVMFPSSRHGSLSIPHSLLASDL